LKDSIIYFRRLKMNNHIKLEETTLEKLANELGIDYQTIVIKSELVNKIKERCIKKNISQ